MTIDPFFHASPIVQLHILFAVHALILGPIALFRARRDIWHKTAGYVWLAAIVGLSVTGLMIPGQIALVGPLGPIHVFSLIALWGVTAGVYHIRKGNVAAHRAALESVWFGAMGLAGLFSLLPGRTMNRMLFGDRIGLGWIAIGLGLVTLAVVWRWHLRRRFEIPLGKAPGLD